MPFTKDKNIIDRLERKLLSRVLIYTLIAISGYFVLDLFLGFHTFGIVSVVVWMGVFGTLAWCNYKNFYFHIIKHTTTVLLLISILGSFVSLNGFKGIFLFDYINLIFFVYFMYTGIYRYVYAGALVLVMVIAYYINVFYPNMIMYQYAGPYENIYFIYGIISRAANALVISISVKVVYEQERRNAFASNKELQAHIHKLNDLYTQLEMQAIEFQEQNEYIHELNMRLEERVLERTERIKEKNKKLIEYAFFNAHKIRGPLARILGLVELTSLEPDIEKEMLEEYFVLIKKSAVELDEVVRNISLLLEQSREED